MMNEVWPDKFGGHWEVVVNCLRTHAHHLDTVTCNQSLQKALYHPGTRANPEMVEETCRVHRAAKWYVGCTQAGRDGNLGVHGSTLVEVNHSSIVAHLGLGSCQRLEDQFQKLLERAQEFAKKVTEQNDLFCLELDRFESKGTADVAKAVDVFAKQHFAVLPYGWFQSETDSAKKLKCVPFKEGHIVCRKHLRIDPEDPLEVKNRSKEAVFIKKGDHCRCLERVRRLIQCSHELALHGFVLEHWDKRWISDVYCQDVLGLPHLTTPEEGEWTIPVPPQNLLELVDDDDCIPHNSDREEEGPSDDEEDTEKPKASMDLDPLNLLGNIMKADPSRASSTLTDGSPSSSTAGGSPSSMNTDDSPQDPEDTDVAHSPHPKLSLSTVPTDASEMCSEGGELHFNKAWDEGDEDGYVTDTEIASVDNPMSPRCSAPPKPEPINYVVVTCEEPGFGCRK